MKKPGLSAGLAFRGRIVSDGRVLLRDPQLRQARSDRIEGRHDLTGGRQQEELVGAARARPEHLLALWTLTMSSNLLDCTTGKSAGFSPLRTPRRAADRRR
jgi:hypothetical protein